MIRIQVALLRREVWEHRSILVVPLVVALVVVLTSLTGQVSINDVQHLDMAILGASNMPENVRAAALTFIMITLSAPMTIAMWILTVFYSLDSLYAERKDRSILFWRSIPVTDFETVLSKLLTALLIIPLVSFAVIAATHLVVLFNISAWLDIRGGSPWHLIWDAVPLADNWTAALVWLMAWPLWLSPFVGWFLFVSAFTKRSPLLVATLPVVLLPLFEKMFFDTSVMAKAFFLRSVKMPMLTNLDKLKSLVGEGEDLERFANVKLSLMSVMDIGGFLANPQLWLGIVVCALFTAAAIYVRRYRDES